MVVLFWVIFIGGALVVGFLAAIAGHAMFFGEDPYEDVPPPYDPPEWKKREKSQFMKEWDAYKKRTYGR